MVFVIIDVHGQPTYGGTWTASCNWDYSCTHSANVTLTGCSLNITSAYLLLDGSRNVTNEGYVSTGTDNYWRLSYNTNSSTLSITWGGGSKKGGNVSVTATPHLVMTCKHGVTYSK